MFFFVFNEPFSETLNLIMKIMMLSMVRIMMIVDVDCGGDDDDIQRKTK